MISRIFVIFTSLCLIGCGKGSDSASRESSAAQTNAPEASKPARVSPADDPELIETESGLKYKVLKRGEGTVSPTHANHVLVHYHGTLLDGRVFDSTLNKGRPYKFPLNSVIPGWVEGLQLMKVGDKYRFVIPPGLAYADEGSGSMIGPNETLVFDIELLGIE